MAGMEQPPETRSSALGDFLRARRASLSPASVGLKSYGPRRVPGLRREELAEIAGVSATYYTRLEQGTAPRPSNQVLDAVARALQLTDVERGHLRRLAGGPPGGSDPIGPLRCDFDHLLDRMPDVAAIVLSPVQHIVGWNRLGHALLAPHLEADAPYGPHPPNKVALMFTDPFARSLHREWEYEATLAVASLRYVSGSFAEDPTLHALVGELSIASPDFARIWAEHPVELCTHGIKRFHHPCVGPVDLRFEILQLPENPGYRLVLHHAAPGSRDDRALSVLASLAATS